MCPKSDISSDWSVGRASRLQSDEQPVRAVAMIRPLLSREIIGKRPVYPSLQVQALGTSHFSDSLGLPTSKILEILLHDL